MKFNQYRPSSKFLRLVVHVLIIKNPLSYRFQRGGNYKLMVDIVGLS